MVALVFPGQGAQQINMGLDVYEAFPIAKKTIDEANQVLDFNLLDVLQQEQLHQTAYTQPALVTISTAFLKVLEERIKMDVKYVAGLSLGEYSAHVAAGSLNFIDAVTLTRQRGKLMEEAGQHMQGAMAAVLKADQALVKALCDEDPGIVSIANYNSPVQVVISGEQEAVDRVCLQLKEHKFRVMPLNVSGAFHSELMKPASESFAQVLETVTCHDSQRLLVSNVTAKVVEEREAIKPLLKQQLTDSVRWQESIEYMIGQGVNTFIEIGPGKTLAGLIKKINRRVQVLNVNDLDSLNTLITQWDQLEVGDEVQ